MPAPFSTAADMTRRRGAGGRSQKLRLFIRGKAISGADSIRGISQFPNAPIITGITIKKIIRKACAVTMVLYSWSLPRKEPGWPNSRRMRMLMEVPNRPPHVPRRK